MPKPRQSEPWKPYEMALVRRFVHGALTYQELLDMLPHRKVHSIRCRIAAVKSEEERRLAAPAFVPGMLDEDDPGMTNQEYQRWMKHC